MLYRLSRPWFNPSGSSCQHEPADGHSGRVAGHHRDGTREIKPRRSRCTAERPPQSPPWRRRCRPARKDTMTPTHTYIPTCIRTYIHTCSFSHSHSHTHRYRHRHTDKQAQCYPPIHTLSYSHAYSHTYLHTHTSTHTQVHTHKHIYSYTYTHIQAHTHTHTHTQTHAALAAGHLLKHPHSLPRPPTWTNRHALPRCFFGLLGIDENVSGVIGNYSFVPALARELSGNIAESVACPNRRLCLSLLNRPFISVNLV